MKKLLLLLLTLGLTATCFAADDDDNKAADRVKSASTILEEIQTAPDTDWKMRAQILSYSRARGAFAGLELNGAVIKIDRESTREFYGRMQPFRTTLETVSSPQGSLPFLQSLSKWAKLASK